MPFIPDITNNQQKLSPNFIPDITKPTPGFIPDKNITINLEDPQLEVIKNLQKENQQRTAELEKTQLKVPISELISPETDVLKKYPALAKSPDSKPPELKPAPEEQENLFTKAKRFIQKPFIKTPEEQIAYSQNVYALSKLMPNIPITSIDENFADIIRMPEVVKATGIQPDPRLKDVGEKAMTGMIAAGILTHPVATAMAVGGFTALNEADNYITSKIKDKEYRFGAGEKALSLLLPDQANEITKDTLDIIDFLGKGAILGGMYKTAPKFAERLTKTTVEKYNLPKKVFISPEKVKSIFQTGEKISPQEQDLVASLGLTGGQYKEALQKGINIKIPTEKIITVTDKPYWAKIKEAFNIRPFEETKIIRAGKPGEVVGQIESKPATATGPIRELKEYEIVDGKRIPVYETKPPEVKPTGITPETKPSSYIEEADGSLVPVFERGAVIPPAEVKPAVSEVAKVVEPAKEVVPGVAGKGEFILNKPQTTNKNAVNQYTIKSNDIDIFGHIYKNEPPAIDTFYLKEGITKKEGIATDNFKELLKEFTNRNEKEFTVTDASTEMIDFLNRKEKQGLIKKSGKYLYKGDNISQAKYKIIESAPTIPPEAPKQVSADESQYKSIIEQQDAKFEGISNDAEGKPALIQFTDNQTGSTLALTPEEFNAENVKSKIELSRQSFEKAGKTEGIAEELQPLAIEARKYKNADEFVQAIWNKLNIEKTNIPGFQDGGVGVASISVAKQLGQLNEKGYPVKGWFESFSDFYNQAVKETEPAPREPKELTDENLIRYGLKLGKIEGIGKTAGKIKSVKEILDRRRSFVRAVQEKYELTDTDLKTITKRDIRLMDNFEFKKFLDDMKIKAERLKEQLHAKGKLLAQIEEKNLDIEPLRKAMKLPTISNMTTEQLQEFDKILEPYQRNDVFLTQRTLETINRTELEGIKTYREARERLAKKLSIQEGKTITPEDLNKLKISEFDRFKGPSALSEKDPFFKMVVEETAKLRLIRDAEYLEIEKNIFKLAKKLKTSLAQKLIPQQKNISKWFDAENKETVKVTKEEADVIQEMQKNLLDAKDYLIKMEAMQKGIATDRYYPHIRRSILEAVKENGVIKAAKEVFDKYKMDETAFNILDTQTGEILANDKFFGNALHRTGALVPTENIIGAYLTYMKTFKKKQALDEITPLILTYSNALTPRKITKTGLLIHGNLIRFMKEWLNMQKGRRITLIAKQGGKIDWGLQGIRTFTTWLDLAVNIPVSVATQVGEFAVTNQLLAGDSFIPFIGLGKMAFAQARSLTPRGNRIIEKYRNFIGKNVWSELIEPAKDIGDRLSEGIFALFSDANTRRNKLFLLGSMTPKEWSAETISPERLAQLKLKAGRYAMIEGAKSIIGATPEAGQFTQYKNWALPILGTTLRNIENLSTLLKKDKKLGTRSLAEFYRILELVGLVVIVKSFIGDDEEDDSMIGKIKRRAYQESTTLIQAIEPKLFLGVPRSQKFLSDLGNNLSTLYKLEEYKTGEKEGELKGLNMLKKQFTPRGIRQFEQKEKSDIE